MRIAVKRLRYALEFGAAVLRPELEPVPKQLAKLQKWLGTYNDAITAQVALPDQLPLQGDEDLALAQALAWQRRSGQAARAKFHAEYQSIVSCLSSPGAERN